MKFVFLCCVWIISFTFTTCLIDNCPSRYSVSTEADRELTVEVHKNKRLCRKLNDATPTDVMTNDVLKPSVAVPYLKDGEYYLNITWEARVDRNKELPKRFVVKFELFDTGRNISNRHECVELKLGSRMSRTLDHRTSVKMFLDCVKLSKLSEEGYFSVQVWQKRVGTCRSSRRVRSHGTCNTIQASSMMLYSMALGDYKHSICSCHYKEAGSQPLVYNTTIDFGNQVAFNVSLYNLPRFLQYVDADIVVEKETIETMRFIPGTLDFQIDDLWINFSTEKIPRKSGTYFLLINYNCIPKSKSAKDIRLPPTCYPGDSFNFTLTKVEEISHEEEPQDNAVTLALAVTGGILVVMITVCVIVYIRRKLVDRRCDQSSSPHHLQNNEEPKNGNVCLKTPLISQKDIPAEQEKRHVIILHHASGSQPIFTSVFQQLKTKSIMCDSGTSGGNWKQFAIESVTSGGKFRSHVIIFLTDGFLELLLSDEKSDLKTSRLKERFYEDIPTVYLETLRTADDTVKQNVVIHLISTNSVKGRELVRDFISHHMFTHSCRTYNYSFHETETIDDEYNKNQFEKLIVNLCV